MVATRISFFLYPPIKVFAFMEDALYRILKRQDVRFEKIGEPVDLHGLRTPYAIRREILLGETEGTMSSITRYYLKEMCQDPEKLWKFVDDNPYLNRSDLQIERICKLFEEHGEEVDISLLLGENVA
jgi:hypothetical protein